MSIYYLYLDFIKWLLGAAILGWLLLCAHVSDRDEIYRAVRVYYKLSNGTYFVSFAYHPISNISNMLYFLSFLPRGTAVD